MRFPSLTRYVAAVALGVMTVPRFAHAQDLGFLSTVFAKVHRMSLFVQSLNPTNAGFLDQAGRGCITLAFCGAGTEVLIDVESPWRRVDIEMGFGAGYLRGVRSKDGEVIDLRGSIRTLPNISTHVTYILNDWIDPFLTGSFGLVDFWNGRAHFANGKQTDARASAFEYGVSLGIGVSPAWANGRAVAEFGYRSRYFGSIGYGTTEALPAGARRAMDLSGWQLNAGWQFDLRPLQRAPDFSGTWVLARVEGGTVPFTLSQERSGAESIRTEIVNAILELSSEPLDYSLQVVTRAVTLNAAGVPQTVRYPEPMRESGTWSRSGTRVVFVAKGTATASQARRIDDELVVLHAETGRRLYFRKAK